MAQENNLITKWLGKFVNALTGLFQAFKEERSLVMHALIGVALLVMAVVARKFIGPAEWAVLAIVAVLPTGMELMNTAIENIVDIVSFKYSIKAKKVKDISAAATLVVALGALAGGLAIDVPAMIALAGG